MVMSNSEVENKLVFYKSNINNIDLISNCLVKRRQL